MKKQQQNEYDARLSAILRQGDPADDRGELSAAESAAMRRQILASIPEESRPLGLPTARMAFGILAAMLLAILLTVSERWRADDREQGQSHLAEQLPPTTDEHDRDSQPLAAETMPPAADDLAMPVTKAESTAPRQMQFVTRGGVRVVWILDPGFEL